MFANMTNVDGFFAGIGIEIDAIALGDAHMGFAEQVNRQATPLPPRSIKRERMLLPFFTLCGGTAFCRGILEALRGKGLSRLHSLLHGALELLQYDTDTRQQDMALQHPFELVFRYSAEKQMRQSAMRILQQFLPRIGRFVEPGFDFFFVVGNVLFPANKRMSGIHLAMPVFSKGYRPKQGKAVP